MLSLGRSVAGNRWCSHYSAGAGAAQGLLQSPVSSFVCTSLYEWLCARFTARLLKLERVSRPLTDVPLTVQEPEPRGRVATERPVVTFLLVYEERSFSALNIQLLHLSARHSLSQKCPGFSGALLQPYPVRDIFGLLT